MSGLHPPFDGMKNRRFPDSAQTEDTGILTLAESIEQSGYKLIATVEQGIAGQWGLDSKEIAGEMLIGEGLKNLILRICESAYLIS